MKTIKTSLAFVFLMFAAVGCSDSVVDANFSESAASKANRPTAPSPNIVDVASGNPDFSILVEAVVFADLADALSARGQRTVFAPTNNAFGALLTALAPLGIDSTEDLFVEANKELVTNILLYHVANGRRDAADVIASSQIRMLNGEFAPVTTEDTPEAENGKVFIDGAEVIIPNLEASNGIVHVIDAVIVPPSALAALGL